MAFKNDKIQIKSFWADCSRSISIVRSSQVFREKYSAKNLLEHSEKGIWLTPNSKGGYVIFDLGCARDLNTVQLAATICEGWRDRGAKQITVSVGDSPNGKWKKVLSKTLNDYRKHKEPLPLVSFTLDEMEKSQYVKMECTEWYGHSCALQYFNVIKSGKYLQQLRT